MTQQSTGQPAEQPQKPFPLPDEESRPFFDGAREGTLMIRRCSACGTHLAPATDYCPECLGADLAWAPASGKGTLHTFAIMHQLYHPAFADETPYNVAVVELEEGPRINSNVVGIPNEELEVGMRLEVTFEDFGEGVSLPKFRPAS